MLRISWKRLLLCVGVLATVLGGGLFGFETQRKLLKFSVVAAVPLDVSSPDRVLASAAPPNFPFQDGPFQETPSQISNAPEGAATPAGEGTGFELLQRTVVTEEIAQYASLVQEDVDRQWLEQSLDQADESGRMSREQSEFFLSLTMSKNPINVSTVCEFGGDGRSAVTWLESAPWVTVYSFSRAVDVPPARANSLGDRADGRIQARELSFLERSYPNRFHHVQLQTADTAAEMTMLGHSLNMPQCKVLSMSAAVRENSAALDGVLDAFKGMASAWHYLLLDGIQCAGPSSSPLAWGAHERSSGAAEPCEVAQTTWETAAARNFVHSYECRMGPAPGWCVGAFGQAASTRVPVEHAYIGVDRVFLNVGDKLIAGNRQFYMTMQEDGNLVIYHEEESPPPKAVWASHTSGPVGEYFLALKSDGNLAVFPGVNGTEEGDHVWQTSADPQDGQYHMIVQDDGTMAIFHGTDPEHNRGLLRRMRPHKRKKKKKSEGRR